MFFCLLLCHMSHVPVKLHFVEQYHVHLKGAIPMRPLVSNSGPEARRIALAAGVPVFQTERGVAWSSRGCPSQRSAFDRPVAAMSSIVPYLNIELVHHKLQSIFQKIQTTHSKTYNASMHATTSPVWPSSLMVCIFRIGNPTDVAAQSTFPRTPAIPSVPVSRPRTSS